MSSMADQVRAMLALQATGRSHVRLRQQHPRPGAGGRRRQRLRLPGVSCPRSFGRCFAEGKGPFRWVALSGDPADIRRTDEAVLELFPENESLARWIRMAQERVPFQGLPARICWLGYGERATGGRPLQRAGRERRGQRADRDRPRPPRFRLGRVAQPRDGGRCATAPTRSPTGRCSTPWSTRAAGATWVSIHHGGGTGIGYSQHAGMVVVADGTDLAAQKLERVLTTDPGHGRHPPRRRRLRARDRGRPGARRAHPDARGWLTYS